MVARDLLEAFDRFLESRGMQLEAVVVGGTALNLLGVVSRVTEDCDILSPVLPLGVLEAARTFAAEVRASGDVLRDDWLNNGPAALADQLPSDWSSRLQPGFAGRALVLRSLARSDLLRSKLFALCDRALDLGDCLALAPSETELASILPWVQRQDTHPGWPAHVEATFQNLARRLGHGV